MGFLELAFDGSELGDVVVKAFGVPNGIGSFVDGSLSGAGVDGINPGPVVDIGDKPGTLVVGTKPGVRVDGGSPGTRVDGENVAGSFVQKSIPVIAPSPTRNKQRRVTFFISIETCSTELLPSPLKLIRRGDVIPST